MEKNQIKSITVERLWLSTELDYTVDEECPLEVFVQSEE